MTRANKDKGWALDSVVLTNEVTSKSKEEITSPPPHGVYVYGLYLEGAAWHRQQFRLVESKQKILFDSMPVMHISAVSNTDASVQLLNKNLNYVCPIYKKPKRTDRNFIATVNLKTNPNVSPDIWTLRGTCLLCDIK